MCREHLDTPEDVQRFLARMDREMDAITAARSKIRNKQRGSPILRRGVKLKKVLRRLHRKAFRLRSKSKPPIT